MALRRRGGGGAPARAKRPREPAVRRGALIASGGRRPDGDGVREGLKSVSDGGTFGPRLGAARGTGRTGGAVADGRGAAPAVGRPRPARGPRGKLPGLGDLLLGCALRDGRGTLPPEAHPICGGSPLGRLGILMTSSPAGRQLAQPLTLSSCGSPHGLLGLIRPSALTDRELTPEPGLRCGGSPPDRPGTLRPSRATDPAGPAETQGTVGTAEPTPRPNLSCAESVSLSCSSNLRCRSLSLSCCSSSKRCASSSSFKRSSW